MDMYALRDEFRRGVKLNQTSWRGLCNTIDVFILVLKHQIPGKLQK